MEEDDKDGNNKGDVDKEVMHGLPKMPDWMMVLETDDKVDVHIECE